MSKQTLGLGLVAMGLIIAIVGVIGLLGSRGGANPVGAVAGTTTTAVAPTSTVSPPASAGGYGAVTTEVPAPTTTAPAPTTTTSVDNRPGIEAFVVAFASAIDRGDVDFLYATLHPAVIAVYDEASCRTFITDQILALMDYRLTGDLTGPVTEEVGGVSFQSYKGPVAFTFQGQDFEAQATFAVEADGPKWFGQCA